MKGLTKFQAFVRGCMIGLAVNMSCLLPGAMGRQPAAAGEAEKAVVNETALPVSSGITAPNEAGSSEARLEKIFRLLRSLAGDGAGSAELDAELGLREWFLHHDALIEAAGIGPCAPSSLVLKIDADGEAPGACICWTPELRPVVIHPIDRVSVMFRQEMLPDGFPMDEYGNITEGMSGLACGLVAIEHSGGVTVTMTIEFELIDDDGRPHQFMAWLPGDPALFFDPVDGPQGSSFWRRVRCVADVAWATITLTACFASLGGCVGTIWFCPLAYEFCCWAASTLFDVFRTCADLEPSGEDWGFVTDSLRRICAYAPGDFPSVP